MKLLRIEKFKVDSLYSLKKEILNLENAGDSQKIDFL
jgi:hypothetical protein